MPFYAQWFREIGFEDVVERKFYWPINAWAKGKYYKDIAEMFQEDILNGLEGLSVKVLGNLGWSKVKVLKFLP